MNSAQDDLKLTPSDALLLNLPQLQVTILVSKLRPFQMSPTQRYPSWQSSTYKAKLSHFYPYFHEKDAENQRIEVEDHRRLYYKTKIIAHIP